MNNKRKNTISSNKISTLETYDLAGYEQKILIEVKNQNSVIEFSGIRLSNSDAHYLEDIHEPINLLM